MKHFTFILAFIFAFTSLKSQQNLVPNWSFEDTLNCGATIQPTMPCAPWFNPNFATPDYYTPYFLNGCGTWLNDPSVGYQLPKTGDAYAGIFVWESNGQRDYIEVKLNDTLIAGKEYKIGFWASVPNGASYQVDRLGAYISKDSLLSPLPFNFNVIPQIQTQQGVLMVDTLNWFEIKGNYIAQGGEQFITIGNFYDNANTMVDSIFGIQPNFFAGYFFIDDVYVVIDTALVIDENANANCDLEVIAINQNVILLKSDCQLNNVTIYNLSGQVVFNSKFPLKTNKISIPLNIPNGLYLVKSGNKMNVTKVSKLFINH